MYFVRPVVWHDILEGRWKSEACLYKTVFQNNECLLFWKKAHIVPFYKIQFFSLNRSTGMSKNSSLILISKCTFDHFFCWDQIYIFEISIKRRFFEFAIVEEKMFHLLEGTINTFWELEGQKWKKPLKILWKRIFKTNLRFLMLFYKILCKTSKLRIFVKITGPLYA
jgi:hypothetical protein